MSIFTDTIYNLFLNFRIGGSRKNSENDFIYINNITDQRQMNNKNGEDLEYCCYNHNNLPRKSPNSIRLYCISDTHERHSVFRDIGETLEVDVLIHAGYK